MNRLDEVLGPAQLVGLLPAAGKTALLCTLTIRLPDGTHC